MVLFSYKLWFLDDENSTADYEDYMRTLRSRHNTRGSKNKGVPRPPPECDQWVRHENVLLPPSVMAEQSIKIACFARARATWL